MTAKRSPGRPRITDPNERQSARLQVLVTPSVFKQINQWAKTLGKSRSELCNDVLIAWLQSQAEHKDGD